MGAEPAPLAPPAAAHLLGDRLEVAQRYVGLLAGTGVTHGLLGPREVPRLWERHVLNCAVVHELLPQGSRVVDVGSGAGLPGLVLALVRPDLDVHLVEPMQRRTAWLADAVTAVDAENVTVHRGRAEELAGTLSAPFVTARAVARLAKLADWCVPLLAPGGRLLALKGASAEQELAEDEPMLRRRWDVRACEVLVLGEHQLPEPTRVVSVAIGDPRPRTGRRSSSGSRSRRSAARG